LLLSYIHSLFDCSLISVIAIYCYHHSDEDDDEEDDEEELQRELEKIKAERAASQKKKDEEEKRLQDELDMRSAMHGNPLLNLDSSAGGSNKVNDKNYYISLIYNII
jgi:hypothetical protein